MLAKAIIATLGVQAMIVVASLVVPLTAASVAQSLGYEPHLVGYYASLTFLAAALASLATPQWVRRYGAIRVHQVMLLVAVAGLAVLSAETLAGFVLSALLIGLAYGPANPASSSLLTRYTSSGTRARVFALKQTAVPLGGAIRGIRRSLSDDADRLARCGVYGCGRLSVRRHCYRWLAPSPGRRRAAAGRQDRCRRGATPDFGEFRACARWESWRFASPQHNSTSLRCLRQCWWSGCDGRRSRRVRRFRLRWPSAWRRDSDGDGSRIMHRRNSCWRRLAR